MGEDFAIEIPEGMGVPMKNETSTRCRASRNVKQSNTRSMLYMYRMLSFILPTATYPPCTMVINDVKWWIGSGDSVYMARIYIYIYIYISPFNKLNMKAIWRSDPITSFNGSHYAAVQNFTITGAYTGWVTLSLIVEPRLETPSETIYPWTRPPTENVWR